MNEKQDPYCTGFLFSSPSFLKGSGTVFNIWGNYYTFNYSSTPKEADERAIASDWKTVGNDLLSAMEKSETRDELIEKVS